ncbi:conserved protein of unknown function precursor containing a T9SS type A C-terminal secretion signal [Tenacibaculum sp. 190524A02b]
MSKMKYNYFFLLMFLIPLTIHAQWIEPKTIQDVSNSSFGNAVHYSKDGNTLAIAAKNGKGMVRIYQNISGTWTQIGNDLTGENDGDAFGTSIDLSSDGSLIAIGAIYNKGTSTDANARRGEVKVFRNINGSWQQVGEDISSYTKDSLFGYSVAISDDGNTLAIGQPNIDVNGYIRSGIVRVFNLESSSWVLKHDLDNTGPSAALGTSVDLSSDGTILVAGAPGYKIPTPDWNNYNGLVRIYSKSAVTGNWWKEKDIYGKHLEEIGAKVTINQNGTIIAIGAPYGNRGKKADGSVKVYQNKTNSWNQLGQTIHGENSEDYLGADISLSNDGTLLAIGISREQNPNKEGAVKVFQLKTNTWKQLGNTIKGSSNTDIFGSAVSLNGEGNQLAVGARGVNKVVTYKLDPSALDPIINIPDVNFKDALLDEGDINNDGEIQVSEAKLITSIYTFNQNIADITGIEYLINLESLSLHDVKIRTINLSKNTKLKHLSIVNIQSNNHLLTDIDISKNTLLNSLKIVNHQLATIDVSKNIALKTIDLSVNKLSSIDVSKNTLLTSLELNGNPINQIDLSKNKMLTKLSLSRYKFNSINLSYNIALKNLSIQNSELTTINLSKNTELSSLILTYNKLTSIDLTKNSKLKSIYLHNNRLTSIDLSDNKEITRFEINGNNLTSLNLKNGNNNLLEKYDFRQNPNLTCIQVDNKTYSDANWSHKKDATAIYSENCATASIEELDKHSFSIYPNPAKQKIEIQIKEAVKNISIYNILGKKVQQDNHKQININKLKSGIYLLKIHTTSGKVGFKKFVKE